MATPETQRLVAGRYALLAELGRGGMGVVWRAEDRVIGRQVAVKELRLPDGLNGERREVLEERVLREARSAGRLNDPTVVTVFDVVADNGSLFLVMELVEAPTLTQWVNANGPMPPAMAAALGTQVLAALESAHAAGIVHRDVKPGNIMVLPSGRVKLADFGIARIDDDPRLTSTGAVVGSPGYLAPERIQYAVASPATDLWALGATLFFAVEGYAAFERPTTAATLYAVANEVPYLSRCRGPLASAVMGLLIATPDARLSAAQAMHLLGLASSQVQAGPTTQVVTKQAQVPGRRFTRTAVLVGSAVLLAAVCFGGGWLTGRFGVTATAVSSPALQTTWTYGTGGQIPQFKLYTGSCAGGSLQTGRAYTAAISCDQPHDIEVFGSNTELDANYKGGYPGQEVLARDAEGFCGLLFASAKIAPVDKDSSLRFRALVPDQQAWDHKKTEAEPEDGARDVFCVVSSADGTQLRNTVIAKPS
ncbi:serine/threonine protein kinase [Kutzneria buriramensis]|uniref:non-specific serine/threonine protein kinase n=1 Tax=Kutzneria buriramensis TaxID=1045776 RepID=A0A3E0HKU3_9PSEU|nr:serine/threonine-protein kinase [Kutzneria buriramensis]REH46960.1 serine/threonine protein kinase [Kutzneria buriramensis]